MKKTPRKVPVWINGKSGRMGQEILALLHEHKFLTSCGGSDHDGLRTKDMMGSDVIIDFSSPAGNLKLLKAASDLENKIFLIGTTGLPAPQLEKWFATAKKMGHLVLHAPNTSLGIFTIAQQIGKFAKTLASANFDLEMIETHHNQKKDAPSGTALFLAKMIQKECPTLKIVSRHEGLRERNTIGVHAVRGGGIFGEHVIRFIGAHEEVTITHRAFSRQLFATGAIALVEKLISFKKTGFYTLDQL